MMKVWCYVLSSMRGLRAAESHTAPPHLQSWRLESCQQGRETDKWLLPLPHKKETAKAVMEVPRMLLLL